MASPAIDWEVHPVSGAIGAEIVGPDLSALDAEQWVALRALWLEHLVLFFPGQFLGPDDHVSLARRFGEPEIHPYLKKRDEEHPEIVVIEGLRSADVWHTDVTFSPTPPLAAVLRMVECPSTGGDTIFTNQYLAFETLSAPLRDLVEGLTAVHTAFGYGHPEQESTHPVVRIHPETGRRSLFVNRYFTDRIVELHPAESELLLGHLFTWSEQPRFQCRYSWSEGTVAIWDNRCTQHYVVVDFDQHRAIERVTVIGDVPRGSPSPWAHLAEQDAHGEMVQPGDVVFALDERTNSLTV